MELSRWPSLIWLHLLLAFAPFQIHPAVAEESAVDEELCSNVDYSAGMGPVRDQSSASWCWAFASSDLITHAQQLPSGQQFSAIDIALSGLQLDSQTLISAGARGDDISTFHWARRAAQTVDSNRDDFRKLPVLDRGSVTFNALVGMNIRERLCLESEVPSEKPRNSMRVGPNSRLGIKLPAQTDISRLVPLMPAELDFISQELKKWGDRSAKVKDTNTTEHPYFICYRENAPLFKNLTTFLEEFNELVLKDMGERVKNSCKKAPALKPMSAYRLAFDPGPESSAAFLAADFLKHSGPLSLSYPAEFLTKGWNPEAHTSSNHSSVLAGMRWNEGTKSCEFKLRNSWGTDCDFYRDELKSRCEGGNIWVSDKELNTISHHFSLILPLGKK